MIETLKQELSGLNAKIKGWRGILLSWLGALLAYSETVFNVAGQLLMSGNPLITDWKGAVVVAALITLKNIFTDVGKK